jgi:hypothetical protein
MLVCSFLNVARFRSLGTRTKNRVAFMEKLRSESIQRILTTVKLKSFVSSSGIKNGKINTNENIILQLFRASVKIGLLN